MSKQFKKSKEKVIAVNPPKEIKLVPPKTPQLAEPKPIWIFFLFFVLGLVLYGNTMQNGYSMDDELVTLKQPNVEMGIAGIPKILGARYSVNEKQHYEYRPIVLITFAIEYQIFGRDPVPSHLINILFYALVCFLIYKLVKKIFTNYHWVLALLTALLFLIHPMHSEVVASLKNRDEMLALLFSLITLNFLLNLTDTGKWKYLFFAVPCFIIALFSKQSALPFIAIIPTVIILSRNVKPLKVIGLTVLIVVGTMVTAKLFLANVLEKGDTLRELYFFENPLFEGVYSLADKIIVALATLGYYIKMMVLPYPLVSYYGYNTFECFEFGLNHIIGLVGVIGIVFLIYKYYKTNKPLVLGIIMFCISISMFTNFLVPVVGIVAERFAFEASLGFCLFLSSVILLIAGSLELKKGVKFSEINSKIKYAFVALTIIAAIVIIPRNKAWFSTSSLYHTDVKILPESAKLHSLLGTSHTNLLNSHVRGDTALTADAIRLHADTAISHFKKSLLVYPNYIAVNNNLGTVYFTFKTNLDSAGYYFNRACELDTAYVEAYFNMGNYYDQRAEFAAQKLGWINAMVGGTDTVATRTGDRKISREIDAYDEIFLKLIALKNQLYTVFNNYVTGKASGDPKGSVLDVILFYFKQMKQMKGIELDHMGLADAIITVYQGATKNDASNRTTQRVDSTVNKYYFQSITNAILRDKKVQLSDINNDLRREIRGDLRNYRAKCIFYLKKSMRLNKSYMTAYTKLTQVLARWSMFNEIIEIHKAILFNPMYKSYSVNFSLADGYFSKGDYKTAAKHIITGLKEMEIVTKRINLVSQNFSKAQNNYVLSTLIRAKQNNAGHVDYLINKFMYQISNRLPYEAVQIQQLYNMIKTL